MAIYCQIAIPIYAVVVLRRVGGGKGRGWEGRRTLSALLVILCEQWSLHSLHNFSEFNTPVFESW